MQSRVRTELFTLPNEPSSVLNINPAPVLVFILLFVDTVKKPEQTEENVAGVGQTSACHVGLFNLIICHLSCFTLMETVWNH